MDSLPPPAEDTACPHGAIPATPFDQLNFACEAITDQLLHVVISFDGRLREDTLGQALKGAIHCCPILGSRFRDANRPFWDPLPTLHPEELLYLHKTDDPDRMLRQVMVAPIDVPRTAPIRLDLIRAGTDTLCITHHHAAGDARGILDCTRLIAGLYRDPGSPGHGRPVPGRGGEDRSNRRYLSLLNPQATVPADFGAPTLPSPDFFPFRSGTCDARDFATRTVSPAYLERVRGYGKARSVTTGAVLLAATARAFSRFRPPEPGGRFAILHSLDLRRHYAEPGPGLLPCDNLSWCDIANRSVPFEVLLPGDVSGSLDRLVIAASDALRRFRESDGSLLEVLKAEELAAKGLPAAREYVGMAKDAYLRHGCGCPFLVNAGIIPEVCLDFGPALRVTRAFVAAGISTEPPGIVITVSTFRERLTLSFGFCSAAVSRYDAERLLEAILHELPRHGS